MNKCAPLHRSYHEACFILTQGGIPHSTRISAMQVRSGYELDFPVDINDVSAVHNWISVHHISAEAFGLSVACKSQKNPDLFNQS